MAADDRGSPFEFRSFLTDVRMRAANEITDYICKSYFIEIEAPDDRPDPADVHEDVREDLARFFEEIRERVEGPLCDYPVPIGTNTSARCDLLAGHDGDHHPCVGEARAV